MNKRTWKVQGMAAAAARAVATAPSVSAAAKAAGVDRSTLYRWSRSGKIPPLTRRPRRDISATTETAPNSEAPSTWAAWVRQAYVLDATEEALLDLAERALVMARDPALRPADRLSAMARFQALTKQVNLEVPDGEAAISNSARAWPKRIS